VKAVVFDTGPIISLTMNNLLWVIPELKSRFAGEFLIAEAVKIELVDKPLATKKFKFEAIQVRQLVQAGILTVVPDSETRDLSMKLLDKAATFYKAQGQFINVVHYGEMSSVAAALIRGADALVIDERTTRELIEAPRHLAHHLHSKLHTHIESNELAMREFQSQVKGIRVVRSSELAARAYELGLLNKYLLQRDMRKQVLDAILWGLKLNGCAITSEEIDALIHIEA